MSEPTAEPSLIRQRMVLRRAQILLIVAVVGQSLGCAFVAFAIIVDNREWYWWVLLAVLLGSLVYNVQNLRRASRATRSFEQTHGRDAGMQR